MANVTVERHQLDGAAYIILNKSHSPNQTIAFVRERACAHQPIVWIIHYCALLSKKKEFFFYWANRLNSKCPKFNSLFKMKKKNNQMNGFLSLIEHNLTKRHITFSAIDFDFDWWCCVWNIASTKGQWLFHASFILRNIQLKHSFRCVLSLHAIRIIFDTDTRKFKSPKQKSRLL